MRTIRAESRPGLIVTDRAVSDSEVPGQYCSAGGLPAVRGILRRPGCASESLSNGLLTLPVANFGSHATLFATNFSSTLTRLLRTHEPAISGLRTEMPLRKGRRIARVHDSFKRGMPIAQFAAGSPSRIHSSLKAACFIVLPSLTK